MTSSSDRKSQVAKSGKRHGSTVYPPPLNLEKEEGRQAGEKQFISKNQQYIERILTVYNHQQLRFVQKTVTIPVDFTYDPHRRREVHSPAFKEKRGR